MDKQTIAQILQRGEDSKHQFKQDISSPAGLAAEMAAFSNTHGGVILIGVTDDHEPVGLSRDRISALNQMISNAASQGIHPPLNPYTEIVDYDGKNLLILSLEEGLLKPYMDNQGVVWVKSGSDKRKVTSREELQRIFQAANLVHADETPLKGTNPNMIDMLWFGAFFERIYGESLNEQELPLETILSNMNLAVGTELNVAGMLLIGLQPERRLPTMCIKAVCYPGTDIHADTYMDSEDITGKLELQFKNAMGFVLRNLLHIQAGQSVNSTGVPEISKAAIEEILVNALVHRDYFASAPIRLFIFSDRVEVISPGHLPNNLTVEKIKAGNSVIRNPVIASFLSKALPYRGLGNGIRRAMREHPAISFEDDREGNQFKVTMWRPVVVR